MKDLNRSTQHWHTYRSVRCAHVRLCFFAYVWRTLVRYDRMGLLKRLRNKVGWRDSSPDLWLLVPGPNQPPF